MKEELVSFELAKKLDELGFYWEDPHLCTLSLVQKWFRQESIYLSVKVRLQDQKFLGWMCDYDVIKNGVSIITGHVHNGDGTTYEEALEKGLLKACELIK